MPARRIDILQAACCVAAIDQQLDEPERDALIHLAEQAGIGHDSLAGILVRALEDEDFLAEQLRLLHDDPVGVIATLLGIAAADGQITIDERVLIRFFAGKLALSNAQFRDAIERADIDHLIGPLLDLSHPEAEFGQDD